LFGRLRRHVAVEAPRFSVAGAQLGAERL